MIISACLSFSIHVQTTALSTVHCHSHPCSLQYPLCPTQLTFLLLPWTMETPTPPKHSYLYTNLQGIMSLHSYGNLCTNELNSKRKRETSIIILCKWYHNSNIDLIMTHYSQLLASLATSYVLWSVVIQSATDTNGFT